MEDVEIERTDDEPQRAKYAIQVRGYISKIIKNLNGTYYSPMHVIFVHVIFLDSGNFPSFLKFLEFKVTCITLGVSAITLFLYRVVVNLSEYSTEETLLYSSCL